ncbi:protein GAMETE EXPRESSED 3 [Cynara cardunculus var. scolymus]|uniref:protein GAMETE EXPRESSED 3 n=1 Tax=Cynara cardunculus var. scolymus TaxID=59895 RepID=UPI000D62D3B4|nr:protein GAMETE EXPRESSED 3 [Cynara cardunculus var. scolymus]
MFTSVSARWEWESGANPHLISDQEPRPKPTTRLLNPLIGDDGKIYVCLEKNLLVFQSNGSISRRMPLNYTCNVGITPVLGASRKVYLVAENRVLKINIRNTQTPESSGEVFLGPETGVEGMDEIIGLSVSTYSSCVLININRRGLFSYRFDGKLRWSTGPVISRMGYRQGCRKNLTGCYFDSVPVIDNCDANVYVSNNQGELYSLSIRSPHFKWIQDYSSLGNFTITAGNNGQLYLTVPDIAIILALDVSNGSVLWQQSIGPLSTQDSAPVVNVNGWISIGSLDGFLYSISPSGVLKKFPGTDIMDVASHVNPVLDCSGYAVYISQTKMEGLISRTIGEYTYVSAMKPVNAIFKLLVPATGSVYWNESYPGDLVSSYLFSGSDLRHFVMDERMLLAFLSISNTGNPLSCFSTRQKLASSCSMMDMKPVSIDKDNDKASTLFLVLETILVIILAALVRFCCIFWKKKKVQNQDLGKFLEKRCSLQLQKKVFDKTIRELEEKASAAEGSAGNQVVEELGDLVRERESVERKLSTTYSLGKDTTTPRSKSLLPVSSSDKKTKSFSSRSGKKESVTIFHGFSNSNSTCSSYSSSVDEEMEKELLKGKAPIETENPSSDDDDDDDDGSDHEEAVKIVDDGGGSMRRRSLSLTRNKSSSSSK